MTCCLAPLNANNNNDLSGLLSDAARVARGAASRGIEFLFAYNASLIIICKILV
jgi:hypothetical protein